MGSDRFIVFEAVRKSYDGESYVVRGLDLSVAQGEFLTLLGPSGSGKTTTLMMLAGFEDADAAGRSRLDGERIEQRAAASPQHRGGVPELRAVPAHDGRARTSPFRCRCVASPRPRWTQRVARALDMVRMAGFGSGGPHQLSGGQQQRIALARALVFEPQARADGRAARCARQAVARAHAARDQAPARAPRHQRRLRHPRPGRGADHVRPGRRVQRRHPAAGRAAGRALRGTGKHVRRASSSARTMPSAGRCASCPAPGAARSRTDDGSIIHAIAGDGLAAGARRRLALRPSGCSVAGGRDPAAIASRPASKSSSTHGDHTRLARRACGRSDILVKVPAPPFGAWHRRHHRYRLAADDCRALPLN